MKPRNPFIALILAIFAPGLGQVYNGHIRKGLLFYIFIMVGFLYIFRGIGLYTSFPIMVFILLSILLLQLYFIVNSFLTAKKQENYLLKWYNKWYIYTAFIVLEGILFNVQKIVFPFLYPIGTQTFEILSPSMEPTIQTGDKIVADFSFERKSISIGDLVVFHPSGNQKELFISRVAALPGDKFQMTDNFICLNSKKSVVKKIKSFDSKHPLLSDVTMFSETLPNGRTIFIYKNLVSDSSIANRHEIIVPKDSVLMISDNRDNALDGRYLGVVPLNNITGKILYSFFGKTSDRIGINFKNR